MSGYCFESSCLIHPIAIIYATNCPNLNKWWFPNFSSSIHPNHLLPGPGLPIPSLCPNLCPNLCRFLWNPSYSNPNPSHPCPCRHCPGRAWNYSSARRLGWVFLLRYRWSQKKTVRTWFLKNVSGFCSKGTEFGEILWRMTQVAIISHAVCMTMFQQWRDLKLKGCCGWKAYSSSMQIRPVTSFDHVLTQNWTSWSKPAAKN